MKNRIYTILAVIVTAVMFSSVAYAQTSINQNRALSGGVTAGDTPGFPVTISRPGSFKLTSNLRVPAGAAGIEIKANDVTIDLDGFAIIGPGVQQPPDNAPDGITGGAQNTLIGITVRNGAITKFDDGIALICIGCTTELIRAHNNGNRGIAMAAANAIVRDNVASDNVTDGIQVAGTSHWVGTPFVASATITGNNVVHNGRNGLGVGASSLVSGNVASLNTGIGIHVLARSTISGNTASDNGSDGIFADAPATLQSGSTISGNTASGNTGAGINVLCPANLVGNMALGNGNPPGDIVLTGTVSSCTRTSNNPAP